MSPPPSRPYLLTPGPLTTSPGVKEAMLDDWGSRDEAFVAMTGRVRERLAGLAGAEASHTCVLLQGSGTFSVEAALGTLLPPGGKLLVLANGAYGRRMGEICRYLGRACVLETTPEDVPNDPAALDRALERDRSITHVAVVHCETTSGILNPLPEIAAVAREHRRALVVDAMSTFGGLPIDAAASPFDALVASSNKCLESVPGLGFALVRRERLAEAAGHAHSLVLDLAAQWRGLEGNGQWRFTPPTHVVAALARALDELDAEGGVAGRHRRYAENCRTLVGGMRELGFATLLDDARQAPIIVTFLPPGDPRFAFDRFYRELAARGFLIYPGKLTERESFRMGCIGRLDAAVLRDAVAAAGAALAAMGVPGGAPARGARG